MMVVVMMMMLTNTILTIQGHDDDTTTRYLTALEKIMSENGSTGFYVGNKMTIADLAMWRMWGWIVSYMMMLVMMIMMTIIACFNDYDINDQNIFDNDDKSENQSKQMFQAGGIVDGIPTSLLDAYPQVLEISVTMVSK